MTEELLRKYLLEAIEEFKYKKVLVIGDVLLDKYVYGNVERINPENPGVPLLRVKREDYRLGGAGNVAMNLSSLGAEASLASVIGSDKYRPKIEELCLHNTIGNFFVNEPIRNIIKERFIESDHNHYILRLDHEEPFVHPIDEGSSDRIYSSLSDSNFDAVILSDYNKNMFKKDLGTRVIGLAKQKKIPVIVDSKPSNFLSFKNPTLICPNLKEAKEITKNPHHDHKTLAEEIRRLSESDYVIVTLGKKGMVSYDGRVFNEVSTNVRGVVDVTGAGDTARAIMALGLISGLNLIGTTYLANYAASIVVEKQGTSTVSLEELRERIKED